MSKLVLTLTILVSMVLPSTFASAASTSTNPAVSSAHAVRVMTRNLYIGGDLTLLAGATSLPDLFAKAAQVFGQVQATNFPARAKLLAREIQDADPTLVGLQEAAEWRTGPFGAPPATTVVYDFVASLQTELKNLGLNYTVVRIQPDLDAELPSTLGVDIRLTWRDVVLAKVEDDLTLSNENSAAYASNLVVPTIGGPIAFTHSWISVDATLKGKTFRFISTQLDGDVSYYRFAQSNELLSGPANTSLPVVLVGDLNSDAAEVGPFSAYANLIGAGFADTWLQVNPSKPGFTCCNAPDLLNPTPTLTTRIDHVLTRPGLVVFNSHIVGTDQDNRTPTGLWPSDHAGVVAKLELP
jgi:hypothetical protein